MCCPPERYVKGTLWLGGAAKPQTIEELAARAFAHQSGSLFDCGIGRDHNPADFDRIEDVYARMAFERSVQVPLRQACRVRKLDLAKIGHDLVCPMFEQLRRARRGSDADDKAEVAGTSRFDASCRILEDG